MPSTEHKYLTQLLANLVAKELLVAKHGPAGGYSLARPATFNHCVLRDGPCDWEETCPVHDAWSRAQAALAKDLASTTLADLARIDAAIEADNYQPDTPPHPQPTLRDGQRN